MVPVLVLSANCTVSDCGLSKRCFSWISSSLLIVCVTSPKSLRRGEFFLGRASKRSNSLLSSWFWRRISSISTWYPTIFSLVARMYFAVSLRIPDLDNFFPETKVGTDLRSVSKHPRITPRLFCSKALWCALMPGVFRDFTWSFPFFFPLLLWLWEEK